jgi:hypothetical protein
VGNETDRPPLEQELRYQALTCYGNEELEAGMNCVTWRRKKGLAAKTKSGSASGGTETGGTDRKAQCGILAAAMAKHMQSRETQNQPREMSSGRRTAADDSTRKNQEAEVIDLRADAEDRS